MDKVTKDNPCPVCGRHDACLVAEDGSAALCSRTESDNLRGEPFAGGWLHKLTDNPAPVRCHRPKPKKQKPVPDFYRLTQQYRLQEPATLSRELGVSASSLKRLQVGWDGKGYTFPMFDGWGKCIGIRLRYKKHKFSVTGSKNGLFWPTGMRPDSRKILFICEGPTDTATLLDLGFEAIGRASCGTGLEYIKTMIDRFDRRVVIFSDKDEAKYRPDGSVFYPGIEGAQRLAEGLKSSTRSVRVVKPANYKDVRQWYQNGATKEAVMALVDNARFI